VVFYMSGMLWWARLAQTPDLGTFCPFLPHCLVCHTTYPCLHPLLRLTWGRNWQRLSNWMFSCDTSFLTSFSVEGPSGGERGGGWSVGHQVVEQVHGPAQ
jgi:hypothetical protein